VRIDMNIAYEEKDVAKAHGARWDGQAKKWYVENESASDLSEILNAISQFLNKNLEDIVPVKENGKQYLLKILEFGKVEGEFSKQKPQDAKTIHAWLKSGFVPVSTDVVKMYKLNETEGYPYVSEKDVRPITKEEFFAYKELQSEKTKKAAEKAAQTRAEKKAKKEAEKTDPLKKYARADALLSFVKEKGLLTEEFSQYYDKYCEEHPDKKKISQEPEEKVLGSKGNIKKGNAKKIKHLPNYEEIQGKKILCFDTETTGFSPDKGDELLQVAFVTLENGKMETLFKSLVKPHEKTSWVGAMMKNHISPRMVENAPYPEALREKVQAIVDQAEVLVGYNIDFDIEFLSKGMGIDFSDKIVADPSDYFRQNKPDSKSFTLESCVATYCTQEELDTYKARAHKADADAVATLKALCHQSKLEGFDLESGRESEYER